MNRRKSKKAARKAAVGREPWSAVLMPGRGKRLTQRLGRREQAWVKQHRQPARVWRETGIAVSLPVAIAILEALPQVCGFSEGADLRAAREDIVEASWRGRRSLILAALNQYLDIGEAQVDTLSDEDDARLKAQIGLILAQARIWRQAQEAVPWLRNLLAVESYAYNMSYFALAGVVGIVLLAADNSAPMLQAEERFDEALGAYLAQVRLPLTRRQRGVVNLLLAQCCREMLQDEPLDLVRECLAVSLQVALTSLEGEPEESKVIGMLDDLIEGGAQ